MGGPEIVWTARRHGISDEDMRHAYDHALFGRDVDEGMLMLIGGDRAGRLIEIGVVTNDNGQDVIVHAMPARPKFMR